ncbi:hypothetical protein PWT90_08214 [Aphanocladium album]|nr:hypothetical protein PWT90_08214 [Aphanocladium album]
MKLTAIAGLTLLSAVSAADSVQTAHLLFRDPSAAPVYNLAVLADGSMHDTGDAHTPISLVDAPDYNAATLCAFDFELADGASSPKTEFTIGDDGHTGQVKISPPTPVKGISCVGTCASTGWLTETENGRRADEDSERGHDAASGHVGALQPRDIWLGRARRQLLPANHHSDTLARPDCHCDGPELHNRQDLSSARVLDGGDCESKSRLLPGDGVSGRLRTGLYVCRPGRRLSRGRYRAGLAAPGKWRHGHRLLSQVRTKRTSFSPPSLFAGVVNGFLLSLPRKKRQNRWAATTLADEAQIIDSGYACDGPVTRGYGCISTVENGRTTVVPDPYKGGNATTFRVDASTKIIVSAIRVVYVPERQVSSPAPSPAPSPTPTPASPKTNTRLSRGQEAAIGVCIALAVIAMLVTALLLHRRRRRRRLRAGSDRGGAEGAAAADADADACLKPELEGSGGKHEAPTSETARGAGGGGGGGGSGSASASPAELPGSDKDGPARHEIAELPAGDADVVRFVACQKSSAIRRKPIG